MEPQKFQDHFQLCSEEVIRDEHGDIYDVIGTIHKSDTDFNTLIAYATTSKLDINRYFIEHVTYVGMLRDEEYVGHLNDFIE